MTRRRRRHRLTRPPRRHVDRAARAGAWGGAPAHIEASGDRPFFLLNLWHYAVHVPIQAPPEPVAKYEAKARDTGLTQVDPFETGEPFPTWDNRDARVRRRLVQSDPAYAAMVENLDGNIGRLLDALDRTGDAEDTIVVFTSDNGGLSTAEGSPTSNLPPKEGKGWTEASSAGPAMPRFPPAVADRGRRAPALVAVVRVAFAAPAPRVTGALGMGLLAFQIPGRMEAGTARRGRCGLARGTSG
ncbi:sulfatase-like hydrolase/transferase [Nonomuraea sp. B1E8]|uniref:sulfatase-like hydrolase/transferase n=1 Tax=unclassified Nonomuraea TaxID=2593643 RepID=UPI00325F0C19